MYLGAAALYLTLMIFVVRAAWRRGRAADGSLARASGYALIGFLIVYLPAFWNWLPTALTFKQMCAADAGFSTSVSAEEWIAAHRDEIRRLGGGDPNSSTKSTLTSSGYWRSTFMGGLLATDTRDTKTTRWGMTFERHELRVTDVASGQVLARAINYSLGSRDDARIWLTRRSCFDEDNHPITRMAIFKSSLKGQ